MTQESTLAPEAVEVAVDGRKRIIIEGVSPEIDGGRFPIKRTVGETVAVEADVFADGHDSLSCVLQYRKIGETAWQEVPMRPLVNDRWRGEFPVSELGRHEYVVLAWVDHFKSWRHDLGRWEQAEDIALSLQIGAELVSGDRSAGSRHGGALVDTARWRVGWAAGLEQRRQLGLDKELAQKMFLHADRTLALNYDKRLGVVVEDDAPVLAHGMRCSRVRAARFRQTRYVQGL
ncbi:MAG: maltotransferase domain-containing protein [Candidatus Competibacteraceae bacterium]